MIGIVRTAGVNSEHGGPLCGVEGSRPQKDVKNDTSKASMLLKIKESVRFVLQERTHFGVGKVLFLGKERSFLALNGAI